jgi:hypothetical protein
MFGQTFNHGTLRKLIIYFGKLFNNIYINRLDSNGATIQNMLIPLNYGPKEKFLVRAEGDPEITRPLAIQLPRMSFAMTGFNYDPNRKINKLQRLVVRNPDNPTSSTYQYAPVPYNIEFELYIMVKNAADGTAIIEQIIPYFSPSWTASVNINPDLNQALDMPIFLNDVSSIDTYEGNFMDRRHLVWTLKFTMQGWLFGPTITGGKIINQIDLNYYVPDIGMTISDSINDDALADVQMRITPGLSSNTAVDWFGDANAAWHPSSNSANTISSTDPYGYIVDFIGDV